MKNPEAVLGWGLWFGEVESVIPGGSLLRDWHAPPSLPWWRDAVSWPPPSLSSSPFHIGAEPAGQVKLGEEATPPEQMYFKHV